MLEYDYIGGHGTRGYGKVKFNNVEVNNVFGDVADDVMNKCKGDFGGIVYEVHNFIKLSFPQRYTYRNREIYQVRKKLFIPILCFLLCALRRLIWAEKKNLIGLCKWLRIIN